MDWFFSIKSNISNILNTLKPRRNSTKHHIYHIISCVGKVYVRYLKNTDNTLSIHKEYVINTAAVTVSGVLWCFMVFCGVSWCEVIYIKTPGQSKWGTWDTLHLLHFSCYHLVGGVVLLFMWICVHYLRTHHIFKTYSEFSSFEIDMKL